MKLSTKERIIATGLLPEKGNFTNLKTVREAKEALSFTEEENERLKFQVEEDTGRVNWQEDGSEFAPSLSRHAKKLIRESLELLDEKEELTDDHVSLFEKFVETD